MTATAHRIDTLPIDVIVHIFIFLRPGDVFNGLLLHKSITSAVVTSHPLCRVTLARIVSGYDDGDDRTWEKRCNVLQSSCVFKRFPDLEYVTLDQRRVRHAAGVMMTSRLVASNVDTFCADVIGNRAIRRIRFSKRGVPPESAENVLVTLAQIASLQSIRLEQTPRLSVALVPFCSALWTLSLHQCDIAQHAAADIIERAPHLVVLHLSHNVIEGMDLMVDCLEKLGGASMLEELDLSHNCIVDASPLVRAHRTSKHPGKLFQLRVLNLAFNLIDDVTPLRVVAWACRDQTVMQCNYNPWKRQGVPPPM